MSLAYRHFGKEGAPPVVCFQHFTGTMNNFDPIHTNRRTGVRDGAKDHPLECATMMAHVAQLTLPHELEQVMDTITVNVGAGCARVRLRHRARHARPIW